MPILDVDKAPNIIVLKRCMNPGFAGIDNPLYEDPKTAMLFGDAKKSVDELAATVKSLLSRSFPTSICACATGRGRVRSTTRSLRRSGHVRSEGKHFTAYDADP